MNSKTIIIILSLAIALVVYFFLTNKNEKIEQPIKISKNPEISKPVETKPVEVKVEEKNSKPSDQWSEISKKIAVVEEEINSDNFSSLDGLKELLEKNPDYPKKLAVEAAIKNWEQEKVWSGISKQLIGLEKELNSGNFKRLSIVKDLMANNPTYPMKAHVDESIKRWEQAIVWEDLSKQAEMMEFMMDKGIFSELEALKNMMQKNPEYPRKAHFEKKIKKWEHEVFLLNVPL